MFSENFLQEAIIYGPVILFSLTVHEFFHAWTALKFGDDTAERQGRLTLNPLAHLDLFGTIVMVMSGFRFGWAKPVPVNPMNLRNPRVADIWISAAGPLSNIGLALVAGILFRLFGDTSDTAFRITVAAVQINIFLALFNLIPLFPLDGSHILENLLPPEMAPAYERFSRFAPIILLLLIFTRAHWIFLGPPAMFLIALILGH